jgi:formate dehydrogenase maturation protein FdhE
MNFFDKNIDNWKRLKKQWHLRSNLEMAADVVVLQEEVLKSAEKLVDIALVEKRTWEEVETWDIEETVVIERERMVRYWTKFSRAVQQFNHG